MSTRTIPTRLQGPGLLAALLLALVLTVVVPPGAADAARGRTGDEAAAESQLLAHHNAARGGAGALQRSSDLDAIARAWADRMATDGTLRHNPNFRTQVKNWSRVAENVGFRRDGSLTPVQLAARIGDAYLASPGHRANILSPAHTQVGIGMSIASDGSLWNTVVFRSPAVSSVDASGGSSSGGSSGGESSSGGSTSRPAPASTSSPATAAVSSSAPAVSSGQSRAEQERAAAEEQRRRELERQRIRSVQRPLASLGWYDGPPDGLLGPVTEGALRAFQEAVGLPVSGAPDDATQAALREDDVLTRQAYEEELARQQREAAALAAQTAALRAWLAEHTAAELASQQQARHLLLTVAAQGTMPDHLRGPKSRSTVLAAEAEQPPTGTLIEWLRGPWSEAIGL
jgi:uncharacterized protein YkwD